MTRGSRALLARNVKRGRKRLGISQYRLAELADTPARFISEIETGRSFPGPERLDRIAMALGVQPFQLFLNEEAWDVHDKFEAMSTLAQDIKSRVTSTIDDALNSHLH